MHGHAQHVGRACQACRHRGEAARRDRADPDVWGRRVFQLSVHRRWRHGAPRGRCLLLPPHRGGRGEALGSPGPQSCAAHTRRSALCGGVAPQGRDDGGGAGCWRACSGTSPGTAAACGRGALDGRGEGARGAGAVCRRQVLGIGPQGHLRGSCQWRRLQDGGRLRQRQGVLRGPVRGSLHPQVRRTGTCHPEEQDGPLRRQRQERQRQESPSHDHRGM